MANKYIHVRCAEYSLLVDIRWVKEVINAVSDIDKYIDWRGKAINFLDLTYILMGHKVQKNKHCIILKDNEQGTHYLGLGVGQVLNIETIKNEEFADLPHLDFPFNGYFDKVYISRNDNKCIYRLKNLAILQQG